jgi:hypothetical protein
MPPRGGAGSWSVSAVPVLGDLGDRLQWRVTSSFQAMIERLDERPSSVSEQFGEGPKRFGPPRFARTAP